MLITTKPTTYTISRAKCWSTRNVTSTSATTIMITAIVNNSGTTNNNWLINLIYYKTQ